MAMHFGRSYTVFLSHASTHGNIPLTKFIYTAELSDTEALIPIDTKKCIICNNLQRHSLF